jgi:hypothetical protein
MAATLEAIVSELEMIDHTAVKAHGALDTSINLISDAACKNSSS